MLPLPIGIDLGTTNSVIATIGALGPPRGDPQRRGGRDHAVGRLFRGSGPPVVGDEAKRRQGLGEGQVAAFFKRHMGNPDILLPLGDRECTPVDLSAMVLGKLKADAEKALGRPITKAVITVPAYFNDARSGDDRSRPPRRSRGLEAHQRTDGRGEAYGIGRSGRPETVLVYDLGGGTFDVSLVTRSERELEVRATAGDHNLGGKDWDERIVNQVAEQFSERCGGNLLTDSVQQQDLMIRAEEAKKTLSAREVARIAVHHRGGRESFELTRNDFVRLTSDLMERTQALCEQVLSEAGMTWQSLAGVLLVGGSTRMPMVHDYVRRMSGKPPLTGVNVNEVVALGAAIEAAMLLGVPVGGWRRSATS